MININSQGAAQGRAGRLLSLLAFLLLLALPARADNNPANDSDSITLAIAPVIDIGLDIDTAAVNLSLLMAMGATDYTVSPATLTVLGTFQPQEIEVQAANSSVSPVWTLDADEAAAENQIQLYMLFSVARSSRPLEAEFAGAKNLVTGAAKRAGLLSGTGADENFENNAMTGGADMDNLPAAAERQIWFRLDTPPVTSTTQAQDIQITFTATKDNL